MANVDGASIALKYHTADRTAWRIGLSRSSRDEDADIDVVEDGVSSPESCTGESESWSFGFGIDLVRLHYAEGDRTVHFSWGVGPTFGAYSSEARFTTLVEPDGGSSRRLTQHNELSTWEVGGVVVAGVELFLTKDLSPHADYRLEAAYESGDQESATETTASDGLRSVQRRTHRAGVSAAEPSASA